MTIHNAAAEGRERQEKDRQATADREAKARPDPMHRALVFLLRQAELTNRDVKREARQHIADLDAMPELGADPEAIKEYGSGADPDPAAAAEPTGEAAAGEQSPANTAARLSSRFRKRG